MRYLARVVGTGWPNEIYYTYTYQADNLLDALVKLPLIAVDFSHITDYELKECTQCESCGGDNWVARVLFADPSNELLAWSDI